MVVKLALGSQRKTGIIGSHFADRILQRHRGLGRYAYEGTSLTYLKNDTVNQSEVITRHPVFITLKLLSQKLYWEQNTSMIVNKRIYRDMLQKQLSYALEIIRTRYHALYSDFKQLNERIEMLQTSSERLEMQQLLSVQMKRLRGENIVTGEKEINIDIQRIEELLKEDKMLVEKETATRGTVRKETVREQIPILWERYQEALRQQQIQQNIGLTEVDDRLFVFLDIFQDGSQEERIEFRKFLNSEKIVHKENTEKKENLVMLLQQNPQKLLEILERWQENRVDVQETKQINTATYTVSASDFLKREVVRELLLQSEKFLDLLFQSETVTDKIIENIDFVKEISRDARLEESSVSKENILRVVSENEEVKRRFLERLLENEHIINEIFENKIVQNEIWNNDMSVNQALINKIFTNEAFWNAIHENKTVMQEIFPNELVSGKTVIENNAFRRDVINTASEMVHYLAEKTIQKDDTEIQESIVTQSMLQNELLQKVYDFFQSKIWEQMIENRFWMENTSRVDSIFGTEHYEEIQTLSSIEISKYQFRETEKIRAGILQHLSMLPEVERNHLLQDYRELVFYKQTQISKAEEQKDRDIRRMVLSKEEYKEIGTTEWIRQAKRQELNEMLRYLLTYSSAENKEEIVKIIERSSVIGEKTEILRNIATVAVSNQEILERPYSYVFRKKQLLDVINHGTMQEVSQVLKYMTTHRMTESGLMLQTPERIRSALHHHIHKLTEEQVTSIVENVVWDIQTSSELRRMEETEERNLLQQQRTKQQLTTQQLAKQQIEKQKIEKQQILRQQGYYPVETQKYGMLQQESPMVYKSEEKTQQETRHVEKVLENYRVMEKEETQRIKKTQEKSVQMLTEQSEELHKLKLTVEQQSVAMEELKKRQAPELDKNRLYNDMMKRMERQLHLERQRRGLD